MTLLGLLTRDRQGLSIAVQFTPGEPSRGFLGGEGAPALEADEQAREPCAPGAGGVIFFVVSRHLRDTIEGVADSASRH
jgi:hypothetical protein